MFTTQQGTHPAPLNDAQARQHESAPAILLAQREQQSCNAENLKPSHGLVMLAQLTVYSLWHSAVTVIIEALVKLGQINDH